jgi:hypothetical protein
MATRDATTKQAHAALSSMAKYEPESLVALEQSLALQVREDWYDADVDFAILRLYQFKPEVAKDDVMVNALSKMLMQLRTCVVSTIARVHTNALAQPSPISRWA